MTLDALSDPRERATARWTALLFQTVFGVAPDRTDVSEPVAEQGAPHRRRFAMTTPSGQVAVLTCYGLPSEASASSLEAKLTEAGLALGLSNVQGVALPARNPGRCGAASRGAAALRLDVSPAWLTDAGFPPPAVGATLRILLAVPADGAGLLALPAGEIRCALDLDGDRCAALLAVSQSSAVLRVATAPAPPFTGDSFASIAARVCARCPEGAVLHFATEGVVPEDGRTVQWVVHGERFGLRVFGEDATTVLERPT